jgi:hypothetical protein
VGENAAAVDGKGRRNQERDHESLAPQALAAEQRTGCEQYR